MLITPDLRNWGRSDHLHVALRAIHAFHHQKQRYPGLDDADAVSALAKTINEEAKVEELQDDLVRKSAMFAQSSLVPQTAFFGGIIA